MDNSSLRQFGGWIDPIGSIVVNSGLNCLLHHQADQTMVTLCRIYSTAHTASKRCQSPFSNSFYGAKVRAQGHFDSVIRRYRECLLSSLPPPSPSYPELTPLLNRAYALLPSSPQINDGSAGGPPKEALTHVLHLSPEGEILPHVDNLDASGGVIVGICLGAERILRLRKKGGAEGWDIRLPNGCAYVQR